jgi:hypothetical protein
MRSVDDKNAQVSRLPLAVALLAAVLIAVGTYIFVNLAWLAHLRFTRLTFRRRGGCCDCCTRSAETLSVGGGTFDLSSEVYRSGYLSSFWLPYPEEGNVSRLRERLTPGAEPAPGYDTGSLSTS